MPVAKKHGRTWTWNAFETELSADATSDDTLSLLETGPLQRFGGTTKNPGYLVINPENSRYREFIYYADVVNGELFGVERNQNGTSTDGANFAHETGTIVRAVAMEQMWDDLWEALIDSNVQVAAGVTALATHIGDVRDPHSAAKYITEAALAPYLKLKGGLMTGPLKLASTSAPTASNGAMPKAAVTEADAVVTSAFKAADSAVRSAFASADVAVSDAYKGADSKIITDYKAADDLRLLKTGGTVSGVLTLNGNLVTNSVVYFKQAVGDSRNEYPNIYITSSGRLHKATKTIGPATGTVLGLVKLSDSLTSTSAAASGVAATPKAVKDAIAAAKDSTTYLSLTKTTEQRVKGPVQFESYVYFPEGTNATPQLRFHPDKPDTGIYAHQPGEISFAMDGLRRFTVWSTSAAKTRSIGVIEMRTGDAPYVFSGDGGGGTFKITAKALQWLMTHNNG